MKKELTVKVYIEWLNYEGKIQSRDLIAEFRSENWAKDFIKNALIDDRFSRLVME